MSKGVSILGLGSAGLTGLAIAYEAYAQDDAVSAALAPPLVGTVLALTGEHEDSGRISEIAGGILSSFPMSCVLLGGVAGRVASDHLEMSPAASFATATAVTFGLGKLCLLAKEHLVAKYTPKAIPRL